jgi:adenine-specific DNA-methyltransferase
MPVKYIPYYPNTVEGQAILDNITRKQRLLIYNDTKQKKLMSRILRGMPAYEVETIETVGEPSENLVIRGECISACAYLKEQGIKVDLVYIDPPFASGADYAKKVYIRRNPKLAEKIAEAEQEMDIDELKAFEETMYGDIWQKEDYLNWMYENLMALKSILSETGSIYVHLDWHIGHYVKILLDEVFGEENFQNEIIWHYSGWNKKLKSSFEKRSDSIFVYSKDIDKVIFNSFFEKWESKEEYIKKRKQQAHVDDNGKEYVLSDAGNGNRVKRYLEEALKEGKVVDNVWHMDKVNNSAKESVDYSTQKPEALLERIINASSDKGMVVADFFGGSGVTSKVANDLGRKFIHVDIGINSIQTVRDRLKEAKANFQILEIKDGVSLFRNPQQTMDKLATLIPGLQKGVNGISKFWFGAITKSKEGIVPVYVPNLLNTQEKVLDIPTINTIINQELQNLEVNAKKVIVYYIDIDDQKALEQFIKDNNATEIEVELKDLKNLLHDVVIEDIIDFKTTKTKDGYEMEITKFISDRLIQKIGEFNQKGNLQSIAKGKKFNPISISEEGLELIELIALDCETPLSIGAGVGLQWHSTTEIKIDKLGYVITNGVKSKNFWDGKITCDKKPLRIKVRNISGDETIKIVA